MIIKSLTIKNFRCLKTFEIKFEPLTALIGRNGAGKSSVLQAMDIFYNTAAPITEEDFYNRNTSEPIEITVTFGGLLKSELL